MAVPRGHLRDVDLATFKALPPRVFSAVVSATGSEPVILYRFEDRSGGGVTNHGYLLTRSEEGHHEFIASWSPKGQAKSADVITRMTELLSTPKGFAAEARAKLLPEWADQAADRVVENMPKEALPVLGAVCRSLEKAASPGRGDAWRTICVLAGQAGASSLDMSENSRDGHARAMEVMAEGDDDAPAVVAQVFQGLLETIAAITHNRGTKACIDLADRALTALAEKAEAAHAPAMAR